MDIRASALLSRDQKEGDSRSQRETGALMALPVIPLPPAGNSGGEAGIGPAPPADRQGFGATLQQALTDVSQSQAAASSAENAVASGESGASTSTALVLSDRAEIGWNALVAVRNEVVSAYQTMTNMQI
jgi:flagellar hook-basal body complex protein FliE